MSDEVSQGRDPQRPPVGGRHRRTLVMAGVVVVFIAVVAVVGVIRGKPDPTPTGSTSPAPSSSTSADDGVVAPPLELTSVRCAKLDGSELTVGFQVTNAGTEPLMVQELAPTFPIGGLAPDATGVPDVSTCPSPAQGVPYLLSPGNTALLAFVLTPSDPRCVGPLVVDVTVSYVVTNGGSYSESLHAFPDLGGFDLPSTCN